MIISLSLCLLCLSPFSVILHLLKLLLCVFRFKEIRFTCKFDFIVRNVCESFAVCKITYSGVFEAFVHVLDALNSRMSLRKSIADGVRFRTLI
jgi:hypothetical protein